MTTRKFEGPGTIERPGPVGRLVRILAGIWFFGWFFRNLIIYTKLVSLVVPTHPMLWFGVAASFYFLAEVVNAGFNRAWGRWPQLVVGLLALAAMLFDLALYGSVWGPPLGLLVFLLLVYVSGHLALSFIAAGISATPG